MDAARKGDVGVGVEERELRRDGLHCRVAVDEKKFGGRADVGDARRADFAV